MVKYGDMIATTTIFTQGEIFQQTVADQCTFLVRHLLGQRLTLPHERTSPAVR